MSYGVNDTHIRATIARDQVYATGLTRSDLIDKIERFRHCCDVLEIRTPTPDPAALVGQNLEVHNASFCRQHLVCPLCAARVQNKRRRRFAIPIKEAAANFLHAYILTWTIKDGPDLAERLGHLKDSLSRFRRMGQRRKAGHSAGEFSKVRAGLVSYEIKRGEGSGQWHVHAHGLVFTNQAFDYQVYDREKKREIQKDCRRRGLPTKPALDGAVLQWADLGGRQVPVSKITGEWLTATADSISLDVSKVEGNPDQVYNQAREVLKYVSKLNGHRAQDIADIVADTFNKRFLNTYGSFRSVSDSLAATLRPQDEYSWSLTWDDETAGYGTLRRHRGPVFEDQADTSRKMYLGRQARMLGEYRRQRRREMTRGIWAPGLAATLDRLKAAFRQAVKALWLEYRGALDRAATAAMAAGIRAGHEAAAHRTALQAGIQTCLAFSP